MRRGLLKAGEDGGVLGDLLGRLGLAATQERDAIRGAFMARELKVLHLDRNGVRRTLPAERMALED